MNKEKIKEYMVYLGADDAGVASAEDYNSPTSPALESIFPGVKSIAVGVFKELSNCESDNMQVAMGGRLDIIEFVRHFNYKLARFIERELGSKAMSVPPSYPLYMSLETKGVIGDVSLRHAALAAGLGNFGRHNLIIHPKLGSRVVFTAVLTDLELSSDAPVKEELCSDCGMCVDNCPGGALDEKGKTHSFKCLKNSQPYGIASNIKFWSRFAEAEPEEKKKMVKDEEFWRLYQAGFIGFQYYCFNCIKVCPVGV